MDFISGLWTLLRYLIVQGFGLVLASLVAIIFLYLVLRKHYSLRYTALLGVIFIGAMFLFWFPVGIPKEMQYPFGLKTYGPADGPALPLKNVLAGH